VTPETRDGVAGFRGEGTILTVLAGWFPDFPQGVVSLTGHALMYGDDSIRIELVGHADERATRLIPAGSFRLGSAAPSA